MSLEDDLLTRGQAAQRLRVHPTTVWRHALAGDLPAVRTIGGHLRYRPADIEKLAERLATGARR